MLLCVQCREERSVECVVCCVYSAEKSEVLSEEHQELERRVELIHRVAQLMMKRLQACLSSQGVSADAEKRMVLFHTCYVVSIDHWQTAGTPRVGLGNPPGHYLAYAQRMPDNARCQQ